jgi:hypothetical protein
LQSGDSKFGDAAWLGRTVFDSRWRYTVWPDGTAELYDHHNDPFEYENVAAEPKQSDQLERMKKLLDDGWKAACLPPTR